MNIPKLIFPDVYRYYSIKIREHCNFDFFVESFQMLQNESRANKFSEALNV